MAVAILNILSLTVLFGGRYSIELPRLSFQGRARFTFLLSPRGKVGRVRHTFFRSIFHICRFIETCLPLAPLEL